jgi:hypothetical protein
MPSGWKRPTKIRYARCERVRKMETGAGAPTIYRGMDSAR